MGEKEIDARGLPCPQPVIMTRKVLDEQPEGPIIVLVDDAAQAENVAAMARNQRWDTRIFGEGSEYLTLSLSRDPRFSTAENEPEATEACGVPTRVVVQVSSDKFGGGSDELGDILMRSFLKTVEEIIPRPGAMVFINGGVKLTSEGSVVIDDLRRLNDLGVDIINCGTCLDYFSLKDKLLVGRISNMYEIATLLVNADRVVKP